MFASGDVEVQERATQAVKLLELHTDLFGMVDIAPQLRALFEEELLPVGESAQRKVPVPPELDRASADAAQRWSSFFQFWQF